MISRRAQGLENFIAFAKCLALTLTFWAVLGVLLMRSADSDNYPIDRYVLYNFVAVTGLLFACFREEVQGIAFFQNDFLRAIRVAFRELAYVFGALGVNLVLTKDVGVSRLFLIIFGTSLFGVLLLLQRWLPYFAARWFYEGAQRHNTLLVGPAKRARQLAGWLAAVSRYGIHASGLLTEATGHERINTLPILGTPEDLPTILASHRIQSVILLDTPSIERMRQFMEWTEAHGVRLVTLNTLAEDLERPLQYYRHLGVDFITFREEPLQDPGSRVFKRTFDLVLAAFAVAFVLPPLALLVWLAQRKQAPGPIFYRQERAGMQNESFQIFKFRTMRIDNPDATVQATADDDRIYPFGRFLRRTSLDEIPQFLNVLLGDMSVVGPRPHMLAHNTQFAKALGSYHIRTFVRPGVTGLAQIRGYRGEARSASDIQQRVQCDLEYIERWSLGLDAQIVLRTAAQVIRPPKTAY
ncbi:MAG: exopolysaccharide biosynthesis polyprenyl glycosylphosphotransferase [Terrimicrobiaceae bacterium]|nr:exopolysaccharide biosynthesis polyprenyl glycosylphosphotransferase [Terrimicrobiaceae bacterium]